MSKVENRLKELGVQPANPQRAGGELRPLCGERQSGLQFRPGDDRAGRAQIWWASWARRFLLKVSKAAAKLCAVNLLAQLKAACGGDLDKVRRCVRLGVFVNATPDFTQHPEVGNGASDLIVAASGDAGKHSRAATGAGSLASRRGGRSGRCVRDRMKVRLADGIAGIGSGALERVRQPLTAQRGLTPSLAMSFSTPWRRPARLQCAPDGSRRIWCQKKASAITGIMPAYLKSHSPGRICLRPCLGGCVGTGGRRLLPQAAGCGAVHAGDGPAHPQGPGRGTARADAAESGQGGGGPDRCLVAAHHVVLKKEDWLRQRVMNFYLLRRPTGHLHWTKNRGYGELRTSSWVNSSSAKRKNLAQGVRRAAVVEEGIEFDLADGCGHH